MKFSLSIPGHTQRSLAAIHDGAMAAISFFLALYLRLGDDQFASAEPYLLSSTAIFTFICVTVFISMRLYRGMWRYASMRDLITIVRAVTLSILIFAAVIFILNRSEGLPRSVLFINWMLLLGLLGGPRVAYRLFKESKGTGKTAQKEIIKIPVLLIGANDAGEQFIRDSQRDANALYTVVGLVDDMPAQKGRTIHRVPIYGASDIISLIVKKLERKGVRPQKLIVSDEDMPGANLRALLALSDTLGIPLARLPRMSELKQNIQEKMNIRPIAVEDLLGRSQNVLDRQSMQALIENKRVLVTGAGGTIGGELVRQIASYKPASVTIIELSEFHLYQIERELRGSYPELKLTTVLCDVRDEVHVNNVFKDHAPQLVFHAAAIKHVPIAEENIEEAILTNVFGTRNVAQACVNSKAEIMVMISTDKAVNPTNVMGASKRLAESYCQSLGQTQIQTSTKFITVRFGNVLGSTGSVVPLFSEQLAKGGPITVTDPEMTRYFMTVREAVELVLQASVLGKNSIDKQEFIFVLDMGQPVKILDLAIQMIRLAGLKPYEDIDITFTGLRPGEKLYEELFHISENAVKTAFDGIFLASPRVADMEKLKASFEILLSCCRTRQKEKAVGLLLQLVPEFTRKHAEL